MSEQSGPSHFQAFFEAASFSRVEVVCILIEHSAVVSVPNQSGSSLLHEALRSKKANHVGPGFRHSDVQKSLAYFSNTAQMGRLRIRMGVVHLIWRREMRGLRKLHRSFSSIEPILATTRTRIKFHSGKYEQGDIVISNVVTVKR
jgi:hypothetical protein